MPVRKVFIQQTADLFSNKKLILLFAVNFELIGLGCTLIYGFYVFSLNLYPIRFGWGFFFLGGDKVNPKH